MCKLYLCAYDLHLDMISMCKCNCLHIISVLMISLCARSQCVYDLNVYTISMYIQSLCVNDLYMYITDDYLDMISMCKLYYLQIICV